MTSSALIHCHFKVNWCLGLVPVHVHAHVILSWLKSGPLHHDRWPFGVLLLGTTGPLPVDLRPHKPQQLSVLSQQVSVIFCVSTLRLLLTLLSLPPFDLRGRIWRRPLAQNIWSCSSLTGPYSLFMQEDSHMVCQWVYIPVFCKIKAELPSEFAFFCYLFPLKSVLGTSFIILAKALLEER